MVCTADTAVIAASTNPAECVNSKEEVHEGAKRYRRTAKAKANMDYQRLEKEEKCGRCRRCEKCFLAVERDLVLEVCPVEDREMQKHRRDELLAWSPRYPHRLALSHRPEHCSHEVLSHLALARTMRQ